MILLLGRKRPSIGNVAVIRQMELARSSIIVKTICDFVVLLNFLRRDPSSDRVDRARRNMKEHARFDRMPLEQFLDLSRARSRLKFIGVELADRAYPQGCARICFENIPAFFFCRGQTAGARLFLIGVNLDGQSLRGDEIFDEQRMVEGLLRYLNPDFSDALARGHCKRIGKPRHAPGLFYQNRA